MSNPFRFISLRYAIAEVVIQTQEDDGTRVGEVAGPIQKDMR